MKISSDQKRLFDIIASTVGFFAAALGILFTYEQYLESLHRDRISNAMEFVKLYHSPPISDQVVLVDELLRRIQTDWKTHPTSKSADIVMDDINADPGSAAAVRRLMDFYQEITVCADKGVNDCDSNTIQLEFRDNADHVLRMIQPYICEERTRWGASELQLSSEKFLEKNWPKTGC